jgi:hypothetical protein
VFEAKKFLLPLCGALLVATSASAQTAPEEDYYYTEYEQTWYGWQTLAVDVPLLTTFFVAEASGKDGLALGALGGFVIGSPIVHLAHGQTRPAVVSGFSHLLLPVGGWLALPPVIARVEPSSSTHTRTAIAVTTGGLVATTIDVLFLAYKETETQVEFTHVRWTPQLALHGRDPWLGVVGTF